MNIHPLHSVILIVYVFAQLCILLPTANSSTNSTPNSSSKLQRICNVPVNSFALLSLYQVISPIIHICFYAANESSYGSTVRESTMVPEWQQWHLHKQCATNWSIYHHLLRFFSRMLQRWCTKLHELMHCRRSSSVMPNLCTCNTSAN